MDHIRLFYLFIQYFTLQWQQTLNHIMWCFFISIIYLLQTQALITKKGEKVLMHFKNTGCNRQTCQPHYLMQPQMFGSFSTWILPRDLKMQCIHHIGLHCFQRQVLHHVEKTHKVNVGKFVSVLHMQIQVFYTMWIAVCVCRVECMYSICMYLYVFVWVCMQVYS